MGGGGGACVELEGKAQLGGSNEDRYNVGEFQSRRKSRV